MSLLGAVASAVDWLWGWYVLLGTIVLVLVGWRVLWRLQARHREAEPRGKAKVAVAVVASLLLGFGGLYALEGFQASARSGIHDTMVRNLNLTMGEGDFLDAYKTVGKLTDPSGKPGSIAFLQAKVQADNATLAKDPANATAQKSLSDDQDALASAVKDLHDNRVKWRSLSPNHALWRLQVQPLVLSGNDAAAQTLVLQALDASQVWNVTDLGPGSHPALLDIEPGMNVACARDTDGLCAQPLAPAPLAHSFFDPHLVRPVPLSEGGPEAFDNVGKFDGQMDAQMKWFVYPGVTGLFLAPLVFAGGHILWAAYTPSDTVGFRRYPGKAAGFFLLTMGGIGVLSVLWMHSVPPLDLFGIIAIPFGAWVLRDFSKRSAEGQIAL